MSALTDYYRCECTWAEFGLSGKRSPKAVYFQFENAKAYERIVNGGSSDRRALDKLQHAEVTSQSLSLTFDPDEAINNLKRERYPAALASRLSAGSPAKRVVRRAYYMARPLLPVAVRKHLQRASLRGGQNISFPAWPVDRNADLMLEALLARSMQASGVNSVPFIWFWPAGHSSCVIMTHDVETELGRRFCPELMAMDEACGIRASFQLIPEKRYRVSQDFLERIRERGFEINIHDCNHDGHLFRDRKTFLCRAPRINQHAKVFGAQGFRSGALYRNQEWLAELEISYDMSVPNSARLDPQKGGCCTVFPYFIGKTVELPVTMVQDYSLFHILADYSIELWKQQLELILGAHGLASFIVHPDYIIESRGHKVYQLLLDHLARVRDQQNVWMPLPGEVAQWWRQRSRMKLVTNGADWSIEGEGHERAGIAFACLENGKLKYRIGSDLQTARAYPAEVGFALSASADAR